MPFQWLYYPIIEITAIGCVRNFGKRYKNVKIPLTITISVCYYNYKLAEQLTSGLGRFLERWKCNILVKTQAFMLSLIYIRTRPQALHALGSHVYNYIRQSTLACVITYTCTIVITIGMRTKPIYCLSYYPAS